MKNRKGLVLILALAMTFVGAFSVTAFADSSYDVSVSWPASNYTYNGATREVRPTITWNTSSTIIDRDSTVTQYVQGDSGNYELITTNPKDAGNYKTVVTFDDKTADVSGDTVFYWSISKAPMTIRAKAMIGSDAVTYGKQPGTFVLDSAKAAEGLQSGDTLSNVLEGTQQFTTNYSAGMEAGDYTISPDMSTFNAKNYDLKGQTVALKVKPAELLVKWFNDENVEINPSNLYEYVYDGAMHGVRAEYASEGVYPGDRRDVALAFTTSSKHEGKDAATTDQPFVAEVELANSCTPKVQASYTLKNETLSWTISPRPVYYKYDNASLTCEFDGDYHGLTGQFYDVVDGEALEPEYDTNQNSFVNVKKQDQQVVPYVVNIIGCTPANDGKTKLSNYRFVDGKGSTNVVTSENPVRGTLKITPMPLSITWPDKKTYDWTGKEVVYAPITIAPAEGKEIKGETITFTRTVVGNTGTAVGDYEAKVTDYSVVDSNTTRGASKDDFSLTLPENDAWKIVSTPTSGGESEPELDPAVTDLVNMINALNPASATYPADAQAVVDAYNALTPKQQEDGRLREQTVATKLADAFAEVQAEADKRAAQPVIDQINALDDNSTKEEVEAARAAYEALTPAQQAACGSAIITLQGQEYRIYSTEAKAKKVKNFKVKNLKGKRAKATWKKTANIDGYQITYKAKGVKVKKVTAKASATKRIFKKLKKGKTYTFKIRSFNKVYNPITGEEENVYGKWTTKKVKIKK